MSTSENRNDKIWDRAGIIFTGLTFATMAGFFVWAAVVRHTDVERIDRRLGQVETNVGKVEAQLVKQQTSTWTPAKDILHNCLASNDQATCTVTNMRDEAITTCVRGVLTKRDAAGASLSSLPMCTGRLAPRETRTVSVPWSGGFARDLCSKKTYYGETLDWEQCRFSTEPVDPKTLAQPAATPL